MSLWIPLHIGTAILSFCHAFWINRWSRVVGYGLLVGSASVFLKETTQCVTNGHFDWQSFASIDMQKHDVREKIGSLIIILTVGLQLNASEGLFPSISKWIFNYFSCIFESNIWSYFFCWLIAQRLLNSFFIYPFNYKITKNNFQNKLK